MHKLLFIVGLLLIATAIAIAIFGTGDTTFAVLSPATLGIIVVALSRWKARQQT